MIWILLLLPFVSIGLALAMPGFLDMVVALGRNIPQENLAGDYLTAVAWAMILGASLLAWPVPARDKRPLLWAWLAKCLVTLGFMLFYESHYGLDAYYYFYESGTPGFVWGGLKMGAGTQNLVNLAWLHQQFIPDSYHALKVSFSMVGLLAVYLFYRAAVIFLKRENAGLFYAIALFPSILFWSSILGKDPFVLLGIALYVYGVVGWYELKRARYVLAILLGVFVGALFRVWLGPILVAPLLVFAFLKMRGLAMRVAFLAAVACSFFYLQDQFMARFRIETMDDLLATTNSVSQAWNHGGSAQEVPEAFSDIDTMVGFVPLGAFTALFRPLPGDVPTLFGTLAGLENLLLLVLLLMALKRTRWRELGNPLALWAVLLVLVWAVAYGFVSYQNFGTAVRYKLQILPLLLGLLLYFSRRRSKMPMAEGQAPILP